MPTIHREDGVRFFFYSNEGNEPVHTHVEKGSAEGKIWLDPIIEIESMYGFTPGEVKSIMKIVEQNLESFKKAWYEYFNK
jgi:hypothetical protein